MKMKERIFKIVGNNQKNPFRGDGTICNCLPAAMGMGGGYIPYIFLEIDESDTTAGENGLRKEDTQLV